VSSVRASGRGLSGPWRCARCSREATRADPRPSGRPSSCLQLAQKGRPISTWESPTRPPGQDTRSSGAIERQSPVYAAPSRSRRRPRALRPRPPASPGPRAPQISTRSHPGALTNSDGRRRRFPTRWEEDGRSVAPASRSSLPGRAVGNFVDGEELVHVGSNGRTVARQSGECLLVPATRTPAPSSSSR
jgi:hypothetical protein